MANVFEMITVEKGDPSFSALMNTDRESTHEVPKRTEAWDTSFLASLSSEAA